MANNTLTRADITEAIYEEVGLSRKASAKVVEDMIETILATLQKGHTVKLSGFGNFVVRSKRPRIGRNPKTGEEAPITARRVTVFKASHVLKDRINGKR